MAYPCWERQCPRSPAHTWLHVLEEVLWLTGVLQRLQIPIRAALPRRSLRGWARPGNKKQRDVRQIWRQIQAIPTHFGFVQVASERKVVSVRPNHSLRRQSKQMKFSLKMSQLWLFC